MASNTQLNKDMSRHPLGTATALPDGSTVLTLERDYAAAPERVWAMFTDPAQTPLWWCKTRGRAAAGSSFDLKWQNLKDEGHGIETDWWNGRVLAAQAPTLLELSNGMHGTLRIELQARGTGTQVVFRNVVQLPPEVVLMSLAGWHVHLDHLQEALEVKSVHWQQWWPDFHPSWEQVHAAYVRGPAAT